MESVEKDKIDLGLGRLRRRCTKVTIPITAKMAETPPMVALTIPPTLPFRCFSDGKFIVAPFTFIVCEP